MSKSVQNTGTEKPKVAGTVVGSSKDPSIRIGVGIFVLQAVDTSPDAGAFIVGKRLGSMGAGEWSPEFIFMPSCRILKNEWVVDIELHRIVEHSRWTFGVRRKLRTVRVSRARGRNWIAGSTGEDEVSYNDQLCV